MSSFDDPPRPGRRRFFAGAAGAAGAAALGTLGRAPAVAAMLPPHGMIEPFWGRYQGGIATARQTHTYFAAFDLTTGKRDELIALLRAWTTAAARLTQGREAVEGPQPGHSASGTTASGYTASSYTASSYTASGYAAPRGTASDNTAPGYSPPNDSPPAIPARPSIPRPIASPSPSVSARGCSSRRASTAMGSRRSVPKR